MRYLAALAIGFLIVGSVPWALAQEKDQVIPPFSPEGPTLSAPQASGAASGSVGSQPSSGITSPGIKSICAKVRLGISPFVPPPVIASLCEKRK